MDKLGAVAMAPFTKEPNEIDLYDKHSIPPTTIYSYKKRYQTALVSTQLLKSTSGRWTMHRDIFERRPPLRAPLAKMTDDQQISSIYRQYKKDTDSVASWLASTAKQLGYPLDLLSTGNPPPKATGRLKGKARRDARNGVATGDDFNTPKYIIPLHDFTQLANFIAQRGKAVTIPESFVTTVDRLIELRSGFGKLLVESGKTLSSRYKVHHDYFVDILVGVRGLLCPHRMQKQDTEAVPIHECDEPPSSSDRDVQNRFSALSIDEPSEAFLKKFAAESQHAERPSQYSNDSAIFEAEQQTTGEDLMLLCHALLVDLRGARSMTQAKWLTMEEYFYLPAAAIATNVDISMCRGFIEEIEPLLEKGEGGSFGVMERAAALLCPTDDLLTGEPPTIIDSRDDKLKYFSHFMIPIRALKRIHEQLIIHDSFFISPRESVVVQHGLDHNTLSGEERSDEDILIIEQSFYDMMLALQTIDGYPIEDELFRAVRKYKNTGKLSITLVFAFQIFLDIKHSLEGSMPQIFEKAKLEMQKNLSDLNTYAASNRPNNNVHADETNSILAWFTANRCLITSFTEDKLFQEKKRISRLTGYNPPETVRHRFLQRSPLMCGLYLFYCRTSMHKIALHTDNSVTLIVCAHLYNALKKEGLLKADWPDMEEVLSLLGDDNFWVGGQRPGTQYDYWKSLGLRLGVSPTRFTGRSRPGTEKLIRSGPNSQTLAGVRLVSRHFPLDTITPFESLRNMPERSHKPVTNGDVFTWTRSEIENLMDGRSNSTRHAQSGGKSTAERTNSGIILSLFLKMQLGVESEQMAFPLIQFHQQCKNLLMALMEVFKQLLPNEASLDVMLNRGAIEFIVPTIFHRSISQEKTSLDLLGPAADAVDKWLSSGMRDACVVAARSVGLPLKPLSPEMEAKLEKAMMEATNRMTLRDSTRGLTQE